MDEALERLKSYVVSPEECLALLALSKSVVANANNPQAQAEAAKPAAPVIETDPRLGATLDQFRDQEKSQAQAEGIRDTFGSFALTGWLSKIYEGRVDGGGYLAYVAAALEQANASRLRLYALPAALSSGRRSSKAEHCRARSRAGVAAALLLVLAYDRSAHWRD
jgi:hypothetical protein